MINRKITRLSLASFALPVLFAGNVLAQNEHRHDDFHNGLRDGGRGAQYDQGHDRQYRNGDDRGQYNRDGRDDRGGYQNQNGYDNRQYQDEHRGGIGPGKGALIGGAGGAVLGAIFGGGLKGSLIGGAAGAGVGAIAGQVHQNHGRQRSDQYYPR